MPIDPITGSLITAGAGLVSNAFNAITGNNANKKNREYNTQMYERQKNDNLAQWNLQNAYNSPQEQMKRLQAAGLNPNLIYGSGGQTGGTASPISAPQVQGYHHQAPQIDVATPASQAFSTYFDTQLKQAQLDNLKAQNTDIVNSAILKSAQTMSTLSTGAQTQFKTDFLKDTAHITRQFMAEQASDMHWKQFNNSVLAGSAEDRNALTMQELKQRVSNMKDTGKSIQLGNQLKGIEKGLRENGLSPSDPSYMRIINQILKTQGVSINSLFK